MRGWLSSFRLRLKALVLRRRLEKDLQDEIAFHLEMSGETPEARKRIKALKKSLPGGGWRS